jgi:hypothetical protein
MSYSISNVCAEATMPKVLRWVHLDMDERELRNRVKNKMIRPTTIPQTLEALVFEQAVAREALRLAYIQHKEFATTLKGVQQQRTVGDAFAQDAGPRSIVDNMRSICSSPRAASSRTRRGWSRPRDADRRLRARGIHHAREGQHLHDAAPGRAREVHPPAAMQVFERDCLIYLGTCVAARGMGKPGKPCFKYRIAGDGINESGEMLSGDIRRFPLGEGKTAIASIEPVRGFDLGAGFGKSVEREVRGGTAGIILDARGRPLALPQNESDGKQTMSKWVRALELYPDGQVNHGDTETRRRREAGEE